MSPNTLRTVNSIASLNSPFWNFDDQPSWEFTGSLEAHYDCAKNFHFYNSSSSALKVVYSQKMYWLFCPKQRRQYLSKPGCASSNAGRRCSAAPSILPKPGWAIAHSVHPPLTPLQTIEQNYFPPLAFQPTVKS